VLSTQLSTHTQAAKLTRLQYINSESRVCLRLRLPVSASEAPGQLLPVMSSDSDSDHSAFGRLLRESEVLPSRLAYLVHDAACRQWFGEVLKAGSCCRGSYNQSKELLVTASEGSEVVSTKATGSSSCRCLLAPARTSLTRRLAPRHLQVAALDFFLLGDLPVPSPFARLATKALVPCLALDWDDYHSSVWLRVCDWHVARSPAFVGWATSRALPLATPATIP
jgi:hypothetical protein